MIESDSAESWVLYADNSYVVSRLLWFTGFSAEPPVHAHRTIELYLKAYLVGKGNVVQKKAVWGHDLGELLGFCTNHDVAFSNVALTRRVKFFQRYFDMVRYPTSIDGKLTDGSLIWFSADSSILPLDEIVAFIRPRIVLQRAAWSRSQLGFIKNSADPHWTFQRKALIDSNKHIEEIICARTSAPEVAFDDSFRCDEPGC